MQQFTGEWTRFFDLNDRLQHYRAWGLISPKSKSLRPVMVILGYLKPCVPCEVVGYRSEDTAVIDVDGDLIAINGQYLAELQPSACQSLPRGLCMAEILSDYIVIDIETTGFNRQSDRLIEIATAEYQYGKKIAEYVTLVNPERPIPSGITALTGITDFDVATAPYLEDIAGLLMEFIGNKPLVGHNACSFDIPFLEAQLKAEIANPILDTLPIAREAFPLMPNHKLACLKDALHLSIEGSHRALADVETTNALLWACLAPRRYEQSYWGYILDDKTPKQKCAKAPRQKGISIHDIHPGEAAPSENSALFQKGIVFTGEMTISRETAMQLAVNAGAILQSGVSRKTDYLVVGQQDIRIVGMDGMSTKEVKAHTLNESGKAAIQIISEEEFVRMVNTDSRGAENREFVTDQELYQALIDASQSQLQQLGIPNEMLLVKEISNATVVCLLDPNNPLCYIRARKTGSTISFFADAGKALPYHKLTVHHLENPSLVRAIVTSKDDVALCVDAFIRAIKNKIQSYHTFDCCSRYEECSNARRCVHPNQSEALGCTYGKRLREGIIYYGKNKTI